MANFVHIADARNARAIRKNGLSLSRAHRVVETEFRKAGIFALPVIENFLISNKWDRELKRRGFRETVGVYCSIPDSEMVWAGRYNESKRRMTAAQAAGLLRQTRMLGFETIIPRSIAASEIRIIRAIPQISGWRYFPEAKGRPPFCGCSFCQRGNIKSRGLQEQYENGGLR